MAGQNQNEGIEKLNLEEAFAVVEEAVSKLEDPEISLEESFQVYEQGMKVLKHCNDMIDRVEKKVQVIQENGELHEF